MPAPIYLVNNSSDVTDEQCGQIAAACNIQLARDVAPVWGWLPSPVWAVHKGQTPPAGGWNVVLLDALDQADAAGYHLEDAGGVHGVVGTRVWLDHGGTVLTGADSVSSTASHEICEVFGDAAANVWIDTTGGWSVVRELSDAVEGDTYDINGVSVSNFCYPSYFDVMTAPGARFDHLGKLTRPFTMDAGGYFVWRPDAGGQPQQAFAEAVPDWKREVKARPETRAGRIAARR